VGGGMMNQFFRRGNKDFIKELNRALVIDEIRMKGPISRTDLSANTELGLSTITNIVNELVSEDLICEVGSGNSNGGRKPVLLTLKGTSKIAIGIKIENHRLLLSASDLNGTLFNKTTIPFPQKRSAQEVTSFIITEIEKITKNMNDSELLGIGIATSGLIDSENLKVLYSPIVGWDHIDFSSIQKTFNTPVYLDNDANVFTLAHLWRGKGKEHRNMIGVTIGAGVGAGIVIDRKIYRGEFGGAGELGHIVIQREGTLCYCGQRGCLEMYASDNYLISEAERLKSLGLNTTLANHQKITPEMISDAAENGDWYAQEILFKQGENIGIGLKNVVNLFNPGAIILGGEGIRNQKYLLQGINKELSTHFFKKHQKQLDLFVSDLGENAWLIGACALVLNEFFKIPIYR
jgi:N-acetylglucosamine repressor